MGGEQAAGVLAQITREQRAREGKPVSNVHQSFYDHICWLKSCMVQIQLLITLTKRPLGNIVS